MPGTKRKDAPRMAAAPTKKKQSRKEREAENNSLSDAMADDDLRKTAFALTEREHAHYSRLLIVPGVPKPTGSTCTSLLCAGTCRKELARVTRERKVAGGDYEKGGIEWLYPPRKTRLLIDTDANRFFAVMCGKCNEEEGVVDGLA